MVETRIVTIGDYRYELTQMGAWDGLKCTHVLGKILAPVLVEAQVAGEAEAAGVLASRIGQIFERLSDKDRDMLLTMFAKHTRVEGGEHRGTWLPLYEKFDAHFSGRRFAHLLVWVREYFKMNFSDFLDEARTLFQIETDQEEEPSSPST